MSILRRRPGRRSPFRRGPGFAHDDYAEARGFERLGDDLPLGVVAAVGLDRKLRFNVVRRPLRDGTSGIVLAHVLEPFHAGSFEACIRPWTVAALGLPEAVGTIARLCARRDRKASTSAAWRCLDEQALGIDGYLAEAAPSASQAVLEQALSGGGTAGWLGANDGWLGMDYGCLWLGQRGFVDEPDELDRLVDELQALAERLRAASLAALAAAAGARRAGVGRRAEPGLDRLTAPRSSVRGCGVSSGDAARS